MGHLGLIILKEDFIMNDIKSLLKKEIEAEFLELEKIQIGTDDYKTSVDGITKMIDKSIEISKMEADIDSKKEALYAETDLELKKQKNEHFNKMIVNILSGASIVSGVALTIWGTYKTLKFEETGTVTTTAGRSFINSVVKFFTKN